MKNIIFAALLSVASVYILHAQTQKGNLFAGATLGNTSYSSATDNYDYIDGNNRTTNNKIYLLRASPSLGVFVSDHLIVGGSFGLNYRHDKTQTNITETAPSNSKNLTNTFTVDLGPFLRYYFFQGQPSSTLFYVQGDGTIGTGSGNSSGSGTNSNVSYTSSGKVSNIFTYTGGGSIGITHFIKKDIGIDLGVGYEYSHEKSTNVNNDDKTANTGGNKTTTTNNYDLTTNTNGVTLSAGFHWFIDHKK